MMMLMEAALEAFLPVQLMPRRVFSALRATELGGGAGAGGDSGDRNHVGNRFPPLTARALTRDLDLRTSRRQRRTGTGVATYSGG